jgi:hypothetical protein
MHRKNYTIKKVKTINNLGRKEYYKILVASYLVASSVGSLSGCSAFWFSPLVDLLSRMDVWFLQLMVVGTMRSMAA